MPNIFSQTLTIAQVNLRGLTGRISLVVATMLSVTLVVATLLALGALSQGLETTLERSGDANVALLMRGGSQAENNSIVTREQVDILRSDPDVGLLSPEVNLIIDGYKKEGGERANISLRGLADAGVEIRRGVHLKEGRWPELGAPELAVGRVIADTYSGMEIGDFATLGAAQWRVVGVFETEGSIAESEVWGDLTAVQNLFDRANSYQSVRVKLDEQTDLTTLKALSENDARLQLSVVSEADYFAAQASQTTELAQLLAWPLATLMAVGAIIGAANSMLAAYGARAVEVATLRVLGFSRSAICIGFVVECALLCVVAGLVGAGIALVFIDGLTATTLGGGITRIGYSLEITWPAVLQGVALAGLIGIIGALVPALIASLRPASASLNKS